MTRRCAIVRLMFRLRRLACFAVIVSLLLGAVMSGAFARDHAVQSTTTIAAVGLMPDRCDECGTVNKADNKVAPCKASFVCQAMPGILPIQMSQPSLLGQPVYPDFEPSCLGGTAPPETRPPNT